MENIYVWMGRGRLKRFHFSETEHVAVRGFIDVFISGILNPRSARFLYFIFIGNGELNHMEYFDCGQMARFYSNL